VAYHSVPDRPIQRWIDPRYAVAPKIFEMQMEFLARRRKVVSISGLVSRLERGDVPETGTVVISFDDGYRDTLEVAAPIMERYGLPAIVYLSTGEVTRGVNQWVDELYSAFQSRTKHRLRLDGPDAPLFDLDKEDVLLQAYNSIERRLLAAHRSEREALLDEVKAQLRPLECPPRLMLTWQEVRELTRRHPRFEIGVHTRDHIDLTACEGEVARAELESSMADVTREVKEKVEHFAFPYGRTNEHTREIVAQASLRSAVIGESRSRVQGGTDRFAMPRVEVGGAMTRFRFRTCGAYPDLPLGLLGRT
jgi:peptidoglycan/xylan/chitin deacetylase (PgdA/CDA1 family)